MRKAHSAATALLSFALSSCGGTGPSGAPQDPAPGSVVEGQRAGGITSGNAHYESVIDMLRGKAPGVEIIATPDGQMEVRIRGMNQSMGGGGQEPLVVIDGVPSSRPAGRALMTLSPDDVDRIQVLKDVGSTAVYGTRGANGVIVVTMKKRQAPRP